MAQITTGKRLFGAHSSAEIIVVKAADVQLTCAGQPMVEQRENTEQNAQGDQILVGKRYTDEASGLLVLCTKSGVGPLHADGRELALVSAKPLPSSD